MSQKKKLVNFELEIMKAKRQLDNDLRREKYKTIFFIGSNGLL